VSAQLVNVGDRLRAAAGGGSATFASDQEGPLEPLTGMANLPTLREPTSTRGAVILRIISRRLRRVSLIGTWPVRVPEKSDSGDFAATLARSRVGGPSRREG